LLSKDESRYEKKKEKEEEEEKNTTFRERMLCARLGAMASYSPSSLSSSYNSSYSRGMMLFQTQERRQKIK
jgi:hypothetical protein